MADLGDAYRRVMADLGDASKRLRRPGDQPSTGEADHEGPARFMTIVHGLGGSLGTSETLTGGSRETGARSEAYRRVSPTGGSLASACGRIAPDIWDACRRRAGSDLRGAYV